MENLSQVCTTVLIKTTLYADQRVFPDGFCQMGGLWRTMGADRQYELSK